MSGDVNINTDPVEIRANGIWRLEDGRWLWVEPLSFPARPNVTELRHRWLGRWVLARWEDGTVACGFVDALTWHEGEIRVVLAGGVDIAVNLAHHHDDDGPPAEGRVLESSTTFVHDPQGRDALLAAERAAQTATDALRAAELVLGDAGRWRERGEPAVAQALESAAELVAGTRPKVTATNLDRRG